MTLYLHIDGIEGDVTAKGHKNWIAIDSIHFHVKRMISTSPGRIMDREGTRPAISEITLRKRMDKSSPLLFSESCVGNAKPQIKINLCQTATQFNPYAEITLENAIVSGYAFKKDNGLAVNTEKNHYPLEEITLNFDKIEIRYTPFNSQNQAQSPIPAGYDLRQAVAV